jgi:Flp pilus assembly protein CpaB
MPTFSRNIIISIILAVAAAGALLAYTAHVRDSASAGTNAIKVIVATHEVSVGTTIDQAHSKGYLSYQTVRQSDLADGAITSFDAISGQVVTEALYTGDQLTVNRVGEPKSQTAAYRVTGNFRAVRVPFNPNSGLLSDLQVNDHVDVMTSYRKGDTIITYLSVPNALVLQINLPDNGGLSNGASQGSVMLAVTEQQSLFIANALASASNGQSGNNIWLALVGASGATYQPITVPVLPGPFPNHGLPAAK